MYAHNVMSLQDRIQNSIGSATPVNPRADRRAEMVWMVELLEQTAMIIV